ncbi:unnamed protein product, partial [Closterium sp. NIES-53]
GVGSLMGGGADEGPASGAGAVVSVVASASADVAAAFADVVATAIVCCITANDLVRSASGMVDEYQKPPELKSGSRSGGCVQVVKLSIPSLSELELLDGAIGFEVNPFCHKLAYAE